MPGIVGEVIEAGTNKLAQASERAGKRFAARQAAKESLAKTEKLVQKGVSENAAKVKANTLDGAAKRELDLVLENKTVEKELERLPNKKVQALNQSIADDYESRMDFMPTKEEEALNSAAKQRKQIDAADAADYDTILSGEPEQINTVAANANNPSGSKLRTNQSTTTQAGYAQESPSAYELEMRATEAASVQYGTMTEKEAAKDQAKRVEAEAKRKTEEAKRAAVNEFNYNDKNNQKYFESTSTPWSSTARAALGTAVVGASICAALSSSRGQQSNAQLYGQQPLY